MDTKSHWERVFSGKQSSQVSWHQPHLQVSLDLISRAAPHKQVEIIDVGGGDSTLVDDLLQAGFSRITVLDISSAALDRAKLRLGPLADTVTWLETDILAIQLPPGHFHLWHDRATFHFLTGPQVQRAYIDTLRQSLRPDGHALIATFAQDGPDHCSGLPTARYDADALLAALGADFALLEARSETHMTPTGIEQRFLYCLFRRSANGHSA